MATRYGRTIAVGVHGETGSTTCYADCTKTVTERYAAIGKYKFADESSVEYSSRKREQCNYSDHKAPSAETMASWLEREWTFLAFNNPTYTVAPGGENPAAIINGGSNGARAYRVVETEDNGYSPYGSYLRINETGKYCDGYTQANIGKYRLDTGSDFHEYAHMCLANSWSGSGEATFYHGWNGDGHSLDHVGTFTTTPTTSLHYGCYSSSCPFPTRTSPETVAPGRERQNSSA